MFNNVGILLRVRRHGRILIQKRRRDSKKITTDPHYEVLPHAPYSQDLIPSEFFDDFFSAEFWLFDIIEEYVMDDISYNGSRLPNKCQGNYWISSISVCSITL